MRRKLRSRAADCDDLLAYLAPLRDGTVRAVTAVCASREVAKAGRAPVTLNFAMTIRFADERVSIASWAWSADLAHAASEAALWFGKRNPDGLMLELAQVSDPTTLPVLATA